MSDSFKIGDIVKCSDCSRTGTLVAISLNEFDEEMAKKSQMPIEVSAYDPCSMTCGSCEATRFRRALSPRGICGWCGKTGSEHKGFARNFCNEDCMNNYLNSVMRT